MFFANEKERVASIATREWAKVNVWGRWYKFATGRRLSSLPATPRPPGG